MVQTQTSRFFPGLCFSSDKITGDKGWLSLCFVGERAHTKEGSCAFYDGEYQACIQPQISSCTRKPVPNLTAALFQGESRGLKPLSSKKTLLPSWRALAVAHHKDTEAKILFHSSRGLIILTYILTF